ncbi:hypothetical protein SESBI_51235 [Sesbania bispinosa]|nr:hypothetical protein SESBI_51235 [Sesbania bispinosa]
MGMVIKTCHCPCSKALTYVGNCGSQRKRESTNNGAKKKRAGETGFREISSTREEEYRE